MSIAEEGMRQRRAIHLHEAGHVIVGLACGYRIGEVSSDGEEGHTARIEAESLNVLIAPLKLARSQGRITAAELVEQALAASGNHLTFTLGGIAGESIELGRTALTVRRSADDLASFFVLVGEFTQGFDVPTRHAFAQDAFTSSLDRALAMVKERRGDVVAVADALQSRGVLDESAIREVLEGTRA